VRREDCIHPFDNGFVPKISDDREAIIVTRGSPLISVVSRTRAGEYRIWGGLSSVAAVPLRLPPRRPLSI
jgi:hypothetical protein